jgi:hypothetical protein
MWVVPLQPIEDKNRRKKWKKNIHLLLSLDIGVPGLGTLDSGIISIPYPNHHPQLPSSSQAFKLD